MLAPLDRNAERPLETAKAARARVAFKAHLAVRFEEVLTLETKLGRVRIDACVAGHTIVFHVTARALVDVAPGSESVPICALYPTGRVERKSRWRSRGAS